MQALRDEWASLGREYKRLDVDMFLSGLEASCLEEDHPQYEKHVNRLAIEDGIYKSIKSEIVCDIFDSILRIIKDYSSPDFM